HKAYVDVNEEGTEAAAATAVVMKLTAVIEDESVPVFRADHPFIFLIQDNETGNILFMGRISNPEEP
ncbi:MAG: serpin family protein, partial [Methanogenium sp.]|nr:serpin family protein [Methanogenium sp.]